MRGIALIDYGAGNLTSVRKGFDAAGAQMFTPSAEAPDLAGLGAMPGRCERLPPIVKVPHVGWNSLEVLRPSAILNGVADGTQVYFTHAYAAPLAGETVAATTHGKRFTAVVERDGLFGVQFHPEKSGEAGIRVLSNFVAIAAAHA
jgi:glutamine amidotransferase